MKRRSYVVVLTLLLLLPQLTSAQQRPTERKNAPPAVAAPAVLTPALRLEIEGKVRAAVQGMSAAARVADADGMLKFVSKQEGLCLFGIAGAQVASCADVWAMFRKIWSPENAEREARQEFDGEEIRVLALSPTVAVATWTIAEDRGYGPTGQLTLRGPVADMLVFMLEDGEWRVRSVQQAVWPLPLSRADSCRT